MIREKSKDDKMNPVRHYEDKQAGMSNGEKSVRPVRNSIMG